MIKVKLREKEISKGRKSLYLDFYPSIPHPKTGKPTRREFLGLYLFIKPKSQIDKTHNLETLRIGESIRQKKENLLNKPEIYSEFEKEQLRIKELGELCFVEYFKKLTNKRKKSNHDNWVAASKYLIDFSGGELKFKDLNEKIMEEFKEYLLTTKSNKSDKATLAQNSALSYFNKVKAALKQAYKDDILQKDLNSKIKSIKEQDTRREFVTLEELNTLVKTSCKNEVLKRAALFSALTGLRFSDIKKMDWKDLIFVENQGYFLNYEHKKSKKVEVLPLAEQAYALSNGTINPKEMPQHEKVFQGLKYTSYHTKQLKNWIEDAEITKHITFHCFRHTYATLQLNNGTDIYTVSKLLGHQNLKTTEIYAKIVDETKRTATHKIKLDF